MKTRNFDHIGYSPVLPEVKKEMKKFLNGEGGNPLSRHFMGDQAGTALEKARKQVAGLINATPEEIIFTSCGSESNNLAVKGLLAHKKNKGNHIIASPIEHHSVLHPLKSLQKEGYEITWLDVDDKGFINPEEIAKNIRADTTLVSVTYASPEIGTIEPVDEIGKITEENDIFFHTDAVSAAGQVPVDVKNSNIDLLSLASNPLHGPQGAGALYVNKGVKILPLIEGGIQEKGLRAGTHNLPAIAGFGKAAELASKNMDTRKENLTKIRNRIIEGIMKNIPEVILTGDKEKRLPGLASFCVKYIEGESMNMNLNMEGITSTSGSTCSSEALKVSHVLKAIGVDPVSAQGSIVFSAGVDNELSDAHYIVEKFPPVVTKLRKMSPVYPGD